MRFSIEMAPMSEYLFILVAAEIQSERKLLSRYGIWLLVELCKHKENIEIEVLGRLLAMLFQVCTHIVLSYKYRLIRPPNGLHVVTEFSCVLPVVRCHSLPA